MKKSNYRKQLMWGDIQIGVDVLLMLAVFVSLSYWLKPDGMLYAVFSAGVMAAMALYTHKAKRELRVRIKSLARVESVMTPNPENRHHDDMAAIQ